MKKMFCIIFCLLSFVSVNAQWQSEFDSDWWSDSEDGLNRWFPTGFDSSSTQLIIGGATDTVNIAGTLTIGAYTLPSTDGTVNYVLKTDGSGGVTWQADTGGSGSDSSSYVLKNSRYSPTDSLLTIVELDAAYEPAGITESDISDLQSYLLAGDNITVLDGTAWRMFYTNAAGNVIELALGADETFLMSNGAAVAPTFETAVTDTSHKVAYNDVLGLVDTMDAKTLAATVKGGIAISTGETWKENTDVPADGEIPSWQESDSTLVWKTDATGSVGDTLAYSWGVMDTVITGDLIGYKVESNITIVKITSYTDANTTTFNIEERVATTPNTAGTDALASDQVADNNQQEGTSFSNADFAKDTWICPTISATGDVARFGITVWYIKQSY